MSERNCIETTEFRMNRSKYRPGVCDVSVCCALRGNESQNYAECKYKMKNTQVRQLKRSGEKRISHYLFPLDFSNGARLRLLLCMCMYAVCATVYKIQIMYADCVP